MPITVGKITQLSEKPVRGTYKPVTDGCFPVFNARRGKNTPSVVDTCVEDACRTEPDYTKVVQRLKDPKLARLLHVALGLCTEAGEFADILKRYIYYGAPIDKVHAIEELGDTSWYQRIGVDELGVSFVEMLERNIAKLKARFPEKFTETHAVQRDLAAERKVLEQ